MLMLLRISFLGADCMPAWGKGVGGGGARLRSRGTEVVDVLPEDRVGDCVVVEECLPFFFLRKVVMDIIAAIEPVLDGFMSV